MIFLVGVGSLVCWKLWEHWRGGDDGRTPVEDIHSSPPDSPSKKPSACDRVKGLITSLLTEDLLQDVEDLQDEDPAFIQVSLYPLVHLCVKFF